MLLQLISPKYKLLRENQNLERVLILGKFLLKPIEQLIQFLSEEVESTEGQVLLVQIFRDFAVILENLGDKYLEMGPERLQVDLPVVLDLGQRLIRALLDLLLSVQENSLHLRVQLAQLLSSFSADAFDELNNLVVDLLDARILVPGGRLDKRPPREWLPELGSPEIVLERLESLNFLDYFVQNLLPLFPKAQ